MGSDSARDSNYGAEKYKEILLKNGISYPVEDVQITSINLGGDGFASSCESVIVTFKDEKRNPLSLFVKKQVQNEEYAQQLNACRIYEREQKFFSVLVPDLLQFAKRTPTYGGFLETAVTNCYHADGDMLVLENLKTKGFVILDRMIPHGFEEAKLSLDTIVKVHAATYALIKSIGLDEFQSKYAFIQDKTPWSEAGREFMGPWCQMLVDGAIKVLKAKPLAGSERALEFFLQYESDTFRKMIPQYDIKAPSCGIVVNHGDYWNSNIMFKLNPETKTPEQCVAIDWQTSHLASPVLDLLFYLFGVADGAVRQQEWLNLLRFYYQRFQEYAAQLGQDKIFSYQELEDDFRKKSSIGFIFAMHRIFGLEALGQVGDIGNEEGSFEDNLTSTMSTGLDRLMDEKGEKFSKEILDTFEEFQRIRLP